MSVVEERAPEVTAAGGSAGICFTEEMKGWVTFGEPDHRTGFEQGRADDHHLMFHLTIEVPDIERFIVDPRHEALARGWLRCEPLGGTVPAEGMFNLFVDTDDGSEKRMLYRLYFTDGVGRPLTLSGYKVIRNHRGFQLWPDTSTLYTRVFAGHVLAEQETDAELVCSGILRIHKLDFARQLTTFRGQGMGPGQRLGALIAFNRLFVGELLRTYGAEVGVIGGGVLGGTGAAGVAVVRGQRVAGPMLGRLARQRGLSSAIPRLGFPLQRGRRRAPRRLPARFASSVRPKSKAEQGRELRLKWGTRLAGAVSVIAGTVLIGAEAARVWRLGKLPLSRTDSTPLTGAPRRIRLREVPSVLRVGYCVSSTREATIFNMLASFVVTFGLTRGITITIKRRGRLGPIRDLSAGGRHIHHFVPGAIISLIVGGTAVGQGRSALDRYLAIPFGIGIALFLDEAALLLELEDVYWTEKGALSLQVISATTLALAAIAHAEAQRRRREPGLEADWLAAAAAFDSLRALGRTRRPSSRPTG